MEIDLLSPTDVAALIQLHDRHSSALGSPAVSFTAMHPDSDRRGAISNGICEVFARVLDSVLADCRPVLGNFFCKQPAGKQSEIYIHQDWSFVDEAAHHSLTIWCPLENISSESGTLSVVPGSHRLNRRPRGYVTRFPYPDLHWALTNRYSRQVTAIPGRVVLFHQCLFHWSGENRTTQRRLAANCFVAPREAAVFYPHPDPDRHPNEVEIFQVSEALLTSFTLGRRPEGAESLGFVDSRPEPLSEATLERVLGPLWPTPIPTH